MNNMNTSKQILDNFTKDFHRNLKKKRGIDWSKKNIFDGLGRPDLKEKAKKLWGYDPDTCEDCENMTHTHQEQREGGYSELVRYCEGCGSTQTS